MEISTKQYKVRKQSNPHRTSLQKVQDTLLLPDTNRLKSYPGGGGGEVEQELAEDGYESNVNEQLYKAEATRQLDNAGGN